MSKDGGIIYGGYAAGGMLQLIIKMEKQCNGASLYSGMTFRQGVPNITMPLVLFKTLASGLIFLSPLLGRSYKKAIYWESQI